jgi:hypothetical protein
MDIEVTDHTHKRFQEEEMEEEEEAEQSLTQEVEPTNPSALE